MRSVSRRWLAVAFCTVLSALPGAAEAGGSIKLLRSVG
jgi:hypothetical protein